MWTIPRPRHNQLRLVAIVLPLAALIVGWAFILAPAKIDRTEPGHVASLFVTDIQDNNPNKAYLLTSSAFQKKVTSENFGADTVTPLSDQLPTSEPKMFSIAYPSDGKKDKARVIFNLADDGTSKEHEVIVTMSRSGKDWFVERLDTQIGKAVRPPAKKP